MSDEVWVHDFGAPEISPDGKIVTLVFVAEDGSQVRLAMPSPLNGAFIRALQNADAEARDRYLGNRQEAGGMRKMSVRDPKTFGLTQEPLQGGLILVFDQDTPAEAAFRLPPGAETSLAQALLPYLRQRPPEPGKPN